MIHLDGACLFYKDATKPVKEPTEEEREKITKVRECTKIVWRFLVSFVFCWRFYTTSFHLSFSHALSFSCPFFCSTSTTTYSLTQQQQHTHTHSHTLAHTTHTHTHTHLQDNN